MDVDPGNRAIHRNVKRGGLSRAKSIERRDYSYEVRKHQFLWVRFAFAVLGAPFLLLGVVGIFMPILPPFLLLATACYARSSRRFYNWLMNYHVAGSSIVEWRTYRNIPWRVKLVADKTGDHKVSCSVISSAPL